MDTSNPSPPRQKWQPARKSIPVHRTTDHRTRGGASSSALSADDYAEIQKICRWNGRLFRSCNLERVEQPTASQRATQPTSGAFHVLGDESDDESKGAESGADLAARANAKRVAAEKHAAATVHFVMTIKIQRRNKHGELRVEKTVMRGTWDAIADRLRRDGVVKVITRRDGSWQVVCNICKECGHVTNFNHRWHLRAPIEDDLGRVLAFGSKDDM